MRHRPHVLDDIRRELLRSAKYRHVALHAVAFAHEVRNPLATIALNAELALGDEPADSPRRELLAATLKACDEAAAITRAFLAETCAPADPATAERVEKMCGNLAQTANPRRRSRRCRPQYRP